jgi:carbamate kinase
MTGTVVVGLGGNALVEPGESGTYREQCDHARVMARSIAGLTAAGWRVVVVHGNGPQVGALAVQQHMARDQIPPHPLFSLVAMTQGEIGSILTLALRERLGAGPPGVVTVGTHVIVHVDDPAFTRPTKPIGPFVDREEAERLAVERGWAMVEDAGRGYRRVVPSPEPLGILELAAVRSLVDAGVLVIANGGGGVPVVLTANGYRGVEAVVDKDLAAERLADELGADVLALVTGVPAVAVDYGSASERPLRDVTVVEAERHLQDGQFPAGSMGPKVAAATRFVRHGGSMAVITTPELLLATISSSPWPPSSPTQDVGTRILPVGQPAASR